MTVLQATVLIVDDNPTNLGALLDALQQPGMKILLAQTGEDAIAQAHYAQPDLILLDVLMPGIDGFETCRRLKADKDTADIPVIFMTALSETIDKVRGFEVGGVDYIIKPMQHEEVLARINTHLTIRQLQRKLQEHNQIQDQYVAQLARQQQELRAQNVQLEEVNASKDTFLSLVSHDLRNHFSGLLEYPKLLKMHLDGSKTEALHEDVALLQEAIGGFYDLLENLLTWSRIERGMVELHPQWLDIRANIERVITLFTRHAGHKHIVVTNRVIRQTAAYADPKILETVLRNLLSNAIKFTEPGGHVDIAADSADHFVRVMVLDSGIGIPEPLIPKLFRIDVMHRRMGTAEEQGTGLGLIICKDLIEQQGGSIGVQPNKEKGTIFHFKLPNTTSHSANTLDHNGNRLDQQLQV